MEKSTFDQILNMLPNDSLSCAESEKFRQMWEERLFDSKPGLVGGFSLDITMIKKFKYTRKYYGYEEFVWTFLIDYVTANIRYCPSDLLIRSAQEVRLSKGQLCEYRRFPKTIIKQEYYYPPEDKILVCFLPTLPGDTGVVIDGNHKLNQAFQKKLHTVPCVLVPESMAILSLESTQQSFEFAFLSDVKGLITKCSSPQNLYIFGRDKVLETIDKRTSQAMF